jgi:hypothetical protein
MFMGFGELFSYLLMASSCSADMCQQVTDATVSDGVYLVSHSVNICQGSGLIVYLDFLMSTASHYNLVLALHEAYGCNLGISFLFAIIFFFTMNILVIQGVTAHLSQKLMQVLVLDARLSRSIPIIGVWRPYFTSSRFGVL